MKAAIQIEGLKRNNIGDVFQAIAVADHLDEAPVVLDRENLLSASCLGPMLLIANGWYMHDYANFPPPANVVPVYASVHFSNTEILANPRNVAHFKKHGPIGARDQKTLFMLRAAGIPGYYSGCFTAGIQPRHNKKEGLGLLVVDGVDHPLSDSQVKMIETKLGMAATRVSHDPPSAAQAFSEYSKRAFAHAEDLLRLYCQSNAVVTTKIHCALPCLAMGVPVLLVHPNPHEERLAPAAEFLSILDIKQLSNITPSAMFVKNLKRLKYRQDWIANFINQSVACSGNPVSASPMFKRLKRKAELETYLWHLTLKTCYRAGIQRERLGKVMGVDAKI